MDVLFESFSRKEIISLTKHAHSPNHDDWNSRAHLLASLEQLSPEEKAKIQKIVEFERRRRGGEPAPQEGVGDEVFRWLLQSLTVAQIYDIAHDVVRLSRPVRRNRVTLMDFLLSLKGEVRETLVERCSTPQEKTGKRKTGVGADGETARKRFRRNDDDSGQTSDLEGSSIFPIMPEPDVNNKCISAFIKATGNEAMDLSVCVVCAREVFTRETLEVSIKELTRLDLLQPHKAHPAHVLRDKQLLYLPSVRDDKGQLCLDCHRHVENRKKPPLSLANGMWIGDVPFELKILTLPERVLIAKYLPVAYVVKLFPKKKGSRFWDPNTLHSGFRGNVATYPLNQDDISKMISTDLLPHPPSILSSVLAVTFVGPRGLPVTSLPKMLHIRRKRVHDALLWLKRHNHIYSEINISLANLNELPEDGPPVELTSAIHVSEDIELLEDEHEGYVPEEEGPIDIGGVIPIQSFGVVDVSGTSIPENDLMAHALANTANEQSIKEFAIRRGSAFVNEYARLDPNTQLRTDGGPSNTNHLLGAFPVLFPYGQGGFEVERTVNVPYEQHARWALQYCDRRFRQDMQFVFQVFGIMQKREICRNVKLQMSSPLYHQHQAAIAKLKASDLLEASKEESQGKAITNPAVRALRTNITAVRQKVQGTDESRLSLRSKVWSTTAIFGPPAIWMTINPSDTSDPIALKLVDQNVDLDNFVKLDDESNADRTSMVTNDPYASALYFHTVINIILEEMLGIRKIRSNIVRSKGILGIVQAYIAAREAQGRGSLHLHMLLTLAKMLSAKKIKAALLSVEFRERLKHFISATVKADLGEPNASAALAIPKIVAPAYSRPLDPSTENYDVLSQDLERKLARTVQVHKCSLSSCLRHVGNQVVCKRRAPFDIAEEDWIDKDGHWGPKRRYAYVNNFNPSLMQTVRANHDIKYIPNGEDTKDLTHYISNYAFKKQDKTSNSSALMADKLMYQEEEDKYWSDCAAATKKMLTRCANALTRRQELSAPETISYIMGWEDRYLSHHYVPIYLNGIRRYMKQEYPMLQSNVEGAADNTNMSTLRFVRHQLQEKSQIQTYIDRGEDLVEYNFLDFQTETYERSVTADSNRSRSKRVPYEKESRRKKERVIRSQDHETLPDFIGQWFPNTANGENTELFAAMVLFLLKPWRKPEEIKGNQPTFEMALRRFMVSTEWKYEDMLSNVQYYHDCRGKAAERQENSGANEDKDENGLHDGAQEDDDDVGFLPVNSAIILDDLTITEEDIENKARNATTKEEKDHAKDAMNIAKLYGIFSKTTAVSHGIQRNTRFQLGVDNSPDDLAAIWQKELKRPHQKPKKDAGNVDQGSVNANTSAVEGIIQLTTAPSVVPITDKKSTLNKDQKRAYDIVHNHLQLFRSDKKPKQLLMMVYGEGGTGKTRLIADIAALFELEDARPLLALTALTNVAANLISGDTIHSWAGLPHKIPEIAGQASTSTTSQVNTRRKRMGSTQYLIIDEVSMLTKNALDFLSEVIGQVLQSQVGENDTLPFGGMNVILLGDFHQFPPVANPSAALYSDTHSTERSQRGRLLFKSFEVVVKLKQQMRVDDDIWWGILQRMREGACTKEDVEILEGLMVTDENVPDWERPVLITPRNAVRRQWNKESLKRYCAVEGLRRYVIRAEDTVREGQQPTNVERLTIAGLGPRLTQELERDVEMAVGMEAIVIMNISKGAELSNGTRGTVVAIGIDERDSETKEDEEGRTHLNHMPAYIIFKPDSPNTAKFYGLEEGLIPLLPQRVSFKILANGKEITVKRRQYALSGGYAFTDIKGQGQTLANVYIDLKKPPRGRVTPFNAYVAFSRVRKRADFRLLREFGLELVTTHPSADLRREDARLDGLDKATMRGKVDF